MWIREEGNEFAIPSLHVEWEKAHISMEKKFKHENELDLCLFSAYKLSVGSHSTLWKIKLFDLAQVNSTVSLRMLYHLYIYPLSYKIPQTLLYRFTFHSYFCLECHSVVFCLDIHQGPVPGSYSLRNFPQLLQVGEAFFLGLPCWNHRGQITSGKIIHRLISPSTLRALWSSNCIFFTLISVIPSQGLTV